MTNYLKNITSSSSRFDGSKVLGENSGGDDVKWPWEEETPLWSLIRKGTSMVAGFLLE